MSKKLSRAERIAKKNGNALVRKSPNTLRVASGAGKHAFSRVNVKPSPIVTRKMTDAELQAVVNTSRKSVGHPGH